MTLVQLIEKLTTQGGDASAVFTGLGNIEDRYCILNEGASWQVFYAERGEKHEFRTCDTEQEACAYLWNLLERDATVWQSGRAS